MIKKKEENRFEKWFKERWQHYIEEYCKNFSNEEWIEILKFIKGCQECTWDKLADKWSLFNINYDPLILDLRSLGIIKAHIWDDMETTDDYIYTLTDLGNQLLERLKKEL
jgi:hypothetical protein